MNKMYKLLKVLLALILFMGLSGTAALPNHTGQVRIHPSLAQIAAKTPDQMVAVIVQKADHSDRAEKLVQKLGGQVTKDLHIINAFAGELTAKAVFELSCDLAVRWISPDATVTQSSEPIDTTNLKSVFISTVGADQVWNEGPAYLQGEGVTVAVVDSGECLFCQDLRTPDYQPRYLAQVSVLSGPGNSNPTDYYGHGTLVAGVMGANGTGSNRQWMGVAPDINLVSVKVSNNQGSAHASDVVNGLQWVLDNKSTYNIRVVNLSLNSDTIESYDTSPIDAAVEILWFNQIVVVVAAGNNGTAALYPPANDPFVITVGAANDKGTPGLDDDEVASFSAYGVTESGFAKPDLVAPGTNLISFVSGAKNTIWRTYVDHRTGQSNSTEKYMRVSGTSMSAPVVSGAVALLLQNEPTLTPDQVKYRLMETANKSWPGYDAVKAGAGYLDVFAAVHGGTIESTNTGINTSQLLWTGSEPITWESVSWNSVSWNSVSWNSVSWNSVSWNSVSWNSDYWGD